VAARPSRDQLTLPLLEPAGPERLAEFFFREEERASASPEPADAPRREHLAVRLAAELYALPIERVREIQKVPFVTEVPRAPPEILGLMSLRGEVVAMIDARVLLGLPRPEPGRTARVVLVDPGDGVVGMLVDEVAGVLRLASADIEPVPPGIDREPPLLSGVARMQGRLLGLLDLAALLGERR
jgi:purine-binding chemotaxis protein CheW